MNPADEETRRLKAAELRKAADETDDPRRRERLRDAAAEAEGSALSGSGEGREKPAQ